MEQLILIAIPFCLNLVALGVFAYDKYKAKTGRWRTPERTLLVLAFFGPFGAFAGMMVFRHKTRHAKFALVLLFMLVQILVFHSLVTQEFR